MKTIAINTSSLAFGQAATRACVIAETLYKEYSGKGGFAETQQKLENAGRKLRKHFHGIALIAVGLATPKGGKPSLPLATEYFGELCKRAEAKLLKDHPQANGQPYAKISELISVWGNYKTQVKQFFSGEGVMPEAKADREAMVAEGKNPDNPAEYDPETFVNEMVSRKAGRGANPNDGTTEALSDAVGSSIEVLRTTAAKMDKEWQDENLLPLLTDMVHLIQAALKAKAAGADKATGKPAGNGEVDAPARNAA